jgi:hypothetical protein
VVAMSAEGKVFSKPKWFEQTGYVPHDGQALIHNDATRHRVVCNGRRWGKTLLGGKETETLAFVLNRYHQPMKGWIVGPEFRDSEKEFRVVYDTFKKLGIDELSSKFVSNVDNGNMHITTRWGFDLECRSAKHPETLVGEGLDFVLMVEAGRHKRSTWAQYIRPALSDKRGISLHTGVPEGSSQNSLLYALWQRGQDPSKPAWSSWRMPSWTNNIIFPGGRTDPEILDAEDDLTPDEFDRQYGAQFVERAGRVMAEWDDEVHVKDLQIHPDWPLYLAIDFGYTNDWVLLVIQVDEWNNAYVMREMRWRFKDTEVIAKEALEDPVWGPLIRRAAAIYPDPAAPDDAAILARHWRVPSRGNTGGEIQQRIKIMRSLLRKITPDRDDVPAGEKWPGLVVDRSCHSLCWEMREGWRWPEHRSEVKNESENPLDKDNHGAEALGRFCRGYFGAVATERRSRQRRARIRR